MSCSQWLVALFCVVGTHCVMTGGNLGEPKVSRA